MAIALRRGTFGRVTVTDAATSLRIPAADCVLLQPLRVFAIAAVVVRRPIGAVLAVPAVAWAEWICALALAGVLSAGGYGAWHFTTHVLTPARPAAPVPPVRPRSVPLSDALAVENFQAAMELAGEADTYLAAGKLEWARATAERCLALDPTNPTAQSVLTRLKRAAGGA